MYYPALHKNKTFCCLSSNQQRRRTESIGIHLRKYISHSAHITIFYVLHAIIFTFCKTTVTVAETITPGRQLMKNVSVCHSELNCPSLTFFLSLRSSRAPSDHMMAKTISFCTWWTSSSLFSSLHVNRPSRTSKACRTYMHSSTYPHAIHIIIISSSSSSSSVYLLEYK